MPILNFNPSHAKGWASKKSTRLLVGIGLLVTVVGLGSTLASNINLNSGFNVEFGQGVAQTTSCDDSILVTPISSYQNTNDSDGGFRFSSLEMSGIDNSDGHCSGKVFTLKAYKNGTASPIATYEVEDSGSSFISADGTITSANETSDHASFNLRITGSTILANDVDRISIESNDANSQEYFTTTASVSVDGSIGADVSGATWINHGTSGSNLTLTGSPSQTIGQPGDGGGSIEFNGGSDDQYASGTFSAGNTSIHRLTVEYWMKLESESGNSWPMLFGTNSYDVARNDNFLGFNTWNDELYGFDASSYMGAWHHYVFILSDGARESQEIYVDGVKQTLSANGSEDASSRVFPSDGSFNAFDHRGYRAHAFVGAMNIYPGALPLATIQAHNTSFQSRI